jgi:hypothetical protein
VLSILNFSDCQPSFWAERTPSMPAPYAVFVKARAHENTGDVVMKAFTAPRARAAVESTARTASTIATSPQQNAHVLLRYCAIAKLIANGSPYFVELLISLCRKRQTIRQFKWPDSYGARTAIWYR